MDSPVTIVNPLPRTLHHYEIEAQSVLEAAGRTVAAFSSNASGEIGGLRTSAKIAAGVRLLRRPRQVAQSSPPGGVLICWPIFGLLEPVLWSRLARSRTVTLVIHDPSSLTAATRSYGRSATALGRIASRGTHLRIATHSKLAYDELRGRGWDVDVVLPHPIMPIRHPRPPERSGAGEQATLLVLGQYKPVRDLETLARLAPALNALGYKLVVAGRGWPHVPGWNVIDRFLSESEVETLIRASSCVIIPYRRFYQSGVAVRALEAGRPIAGPHHPFLSDLYGVGWPGLVESESPEDWVSAIDAAVHVPACDVVDCYRRYEDHVAACWAANF